MFKKRKDATKAKKQHKQRSPSPEDPEETVEDYHKSTPPIMNPHRLMVD
jgi:hypothetical protein